MTTNTDTTNLISTHPMVKFNSKEPQPFEGTKKPIAETDTFIDQLNMPLTKTNSSTKSSSCSNSLATFAKRLWSQSSLHSHSWNHHCLDPSSGNNCNSFNETLDNDTECKTSDSQLDYAAIIKAQRQFMDRLRSDQLQKNIHTNADGIPIPVHGRRQSSLTQILGMDKPLLAR
ncbi:hypothetical protein BG005_003766 [Podila minutissima]|nr:hypothetical protein BG005_003766 [Podila minutissima]